jgi:hypothetical protein
MTKNKDLARRTLARIESDLNSWDQQRWGCPLDRNGNLMTYGDAESQVCNTTFCFAGHALLESGAKFSTKSYLQNMDSTGFRTRGGHAIKDVEEAARRKLGMTYGEVQTIFFYATDEETGEPPTFEQLRARVEKVFDL